MIKYGFGAVLALVFMTESIGVWAHEDDHQDGNTTVQETSSKNTLELKTPAPTLAVVLWGNNNVSFQRTLFGASLRLRVTGPDYVYQETFANGNPVFLAEEDNGQPLVDGTYRYELREILELDEEIEEVLSRLSRQEQQTQKRQWRQEGRWPPPHPKTQSAVFQIADGHVIRPN